MNKNTVNDLKTEEHPVINGLRGLSVSGKRGQDATK
jgi:hypothetical protein